MTSLVKKNILEVMRKINKKRFQKFFENLYLLSLHGMGYGEGDFDKDGETSFLKQLGKNKEKLVIFDVGANIGKYSLECVRFVKNSEIYAFEPSKKTFETLKNNLKNFKGIHLHNIGFGRKNKTEILFYNEKNSGLASLHNRNLEHMNILFNKKEKVKIETVDSFCKKNSIKEIDLLKIDVEGNELNVLKGAKNMLKQKKIKRIQFEFGGSNIDSRVFFKDFWKMLHKDYNLYRIIRGGLIPIKNYKHSLELFALINYLADLKW